MPKIKTYNGFDILNMHRWGGFPWGSESNQIVVTTDGIRSVYKGNFSISDPYGSTVFSEIAYSSSTGKKLYEITGINKGWVEFATQVSQSLYSGAENLLQYIFDGNYRNSNSDESLFGGGNINGFGGDDLIGGSTLKDKLIGGSGNDTLIGYGGNDRLFGGSGRDEMFAGGGKDKLYGGSGNDKLYGGSGKDELTGNKGADLLVGGTGSDDFNFRKVSDSTRKSMDTIDGFSGAGRKGGDQIDVSGIDAVKGSKGNQKFDFDGGKGKGHLWAEDDGRDTMIYGNIDNDRFAEIQIRIEDGNRTSASDYFANDFIL